MNPSYTRFRVKDDKRKMFVRLAYAAPLVCVLGVLVTNWLDRSLGDHWSLDVIGFLFAPTLGAFFLGSYAFLFVARADWQNYLWISFIWFCMAWGTYLSFQRAFSWY